MARQRAAPLQIVGVAADTTHEQDGSSKPAAYLWAVASAMMANRVAATEARQSGGRVLSTEQAKALQG
ncbi:MAG: hypothetical protein HPY69_03840 [Armatimonadetes bacterium]|nr:hypothetical protein [Armatimonadota bacterium]